MSKSGYYDNINEIKKYIDIEKPSFISLTPAQKVRRLSSQITNYCQMVRSANYYRKLEQKHPSAMTKRKESEFLELLEATRLIEELKVMTEEELKMYTLHLAHKLEMAIVEKDNKKRYKMYDYIIAGCQHCQSDYSSIRQEIKDIKEGAADIISNIPIM